MSKKLLSIFIIILSVVLLAFVFGYIFRQGILRIFYYTPTKTFLEKGVVQEEVKPSDIEIIAENLNIPWEVTFLPNGEILVTERPGTLRKIWPDKKVITVEGVYHVGEGGLLGMALHPDFERTRWIYLYLTTKIPEGFANRVERYYFESDRLTERTVIIDSIPGAAYHDGGRIAFGPDGYLYITTGDAGNEDSAQDINSLAGKILRIRDDGTIPRDNPFGNAVYSYGHRNSQGLAWDEQNRLWATEHGRSGVLSGFDELNLIEKGVNYGWPVIQGDEKAEGMRTPMVNSGPDETWAPAGAVYLDNRIFFTGLRGESLYEAKISSDGTVEYIRAHWQGTFGRLRAIQKGPDGYFYLTTSNTDGRGNPRPGDDKLIRINPEIFFRVEN